VAVAVRNAEIFACCAGVTVVTIDAVAAVFETAGAGDPGVAASIGAAGVVRPAKGGTTITGGVTTGGGGNHAPALIANMILAFVTSFAGTCGKAPGKTVRVLCKATDRRIP